MLAVERQHISAQGWGDRCEFPGRELLQQFSIGFVRQRIFAMPGRLAGIEVRVLEFDATRGDSLEGGSIPQGRRLEAADEHILRFGCRGLERQRLQWTE